MATTIKAGKSETGAQAKGKAATSAKKAAAKAALAAAKAKATAAKLASKAGASEPAAPASGKRKAPNGGKPAGSPAAVGVTGTQASGGRDGWGAGLGTGTAVLNGLIAATKGDFGIKAIAAECVAKGGRASMGHVQTLARRGLVAMAGRGVWRVTDAGRALWAGRALPKGVIVPSQRDVIDGPCDARLGVFVATKPTKGK